MSRTSPTGWVDPVTPDDWRLMAEWRKALTRREIQRASSGAALAPHRRGERPQNPALNLKTP